MAIFKGVATFKRDKLQLLASLIIPLLLIACSNDMSELQAKVDSMINKQDSNVPPPPKYEEFPKFVYASANLRDPFIPPKRSTSNASKTINVKSCKGPMPDPERRRQPLEEYPLDSLRMVGTLERKGSRWALLRTKDGTIHRVRTNYYIGQNHGRITGISINKITIQEMIENRGSDYDNGCPFRYRPASIALSQ